MSIAAIARLVVGAPMPVHQTWSYGGGEHARSVGEGMEVTNLDAALASSIGWPAERELSEASSGEDGRGRPGAMVGPRILFLVHHTLNTTALMRSVRSTWCRGLRACVYFSDRPTPPSEDGVSAVVSAPESLKRMLTSYQIAQLRYLPALHAIRASAGNRTRALSLSPRPANSRLRSLVGAGDRMLRDGPDGLLGRTEWVVQADDDTFVFYNNLLRRLDGFSNSSDAMRRGEEPMYTGDVIGHADADGWGRKIYSLTYADGWQRRLPVHTSIPFAMGGGATLLNRRALEMMPTAQCLTRSLPGGDWWLWQSDWAIGACADAGGVSATHQPPGVFNQFACSARTLAYCSRKSSRYFPEPCTLHPVRTAEAMQRVWAAAPYSHTSPVRNVRLMRPELPSGFGYGTSPDRAERQHDSPGGSLNADLVDRKRQRARQQENALLYEMEHEKNGVEDGEGEVVVPGPLP